MGVLQIIGPDEKGEGVKIRYKLLRKPVPPEAAALYDSIKGDHSEAVSKLSPRNEESLKELQSKFQPQYEKLQEMLKGTVAEIPYAELNEHRDASVKEINDEKDVMEKNEKDAGIYLQSCESLKA